MKFGVAHWNGRVVSLCGVMSLITLVTGCSDEMQLLNEERTLFGGCHNVYQIMVKGQPQAMLRADAVFTSETTDEHYLTLTKGDDGLEVDLTKCDADSLAMFDQPIESIEGPAGRVVGKLVR